MSRKYLYLFLVGAFLSGCATMPPSQVPLSPLLLASRVSVGSVNYLPASAVADAVRGQEQWDSEARVWAMKGGSHEIRLAPQMSVALIDGAPALLSTPVLIKDGQLLLPESFWTQWMSGWIVPAPPSLPSVPSETFGTVILDPGHGGHDPGAIGRSGLREKAVTLDVALRLRNLLERDGFRVVMTRQRDQFVSLSRRSEIANSEQGADLFVSIHANSSRRRSVSGYEVYYLSEATDDHARAIEAMENATLPAEVGETTGETEAIVWDLLYTEQRTESTRLAAQISQALRQEVSSSNRGVKSARFAVLRESRMPAILVEIGFISHPAEEVRLRNPSYRQHLAEGIRSGICAFKNNHG